jgi:hypothetical protein
VYDTQQQPQLVNVLVQLLTLLHTDAITYYSMGAAD